MYLKYLEGTTKLSLCENTLSEFLEVMGSKAPTPGGGGAAALVGAVGAALSQMVCSLTFGKEKYADVQEEIKGLILQTENARLKMLELIDKDAKAFEPLSKAYSISKDDPKRDKIMEAALESAVSAPLELIDVLCSTLDATQRVAQIGTKLAISDAGIAAVCCKAALQSCALNVFINTKSMQDRAYAKKIDNKTKDLINKYCAKADKIYTEVLSFVS